MSGTALPPRSHEVWGALAVVQPVAPTAECPIHHAGHGHLLSGPTDDARPQLSVPAGQAPDLLGARELSAGLAHRIREVATPLGVVVRIVNRDLPRAHARTGATVMVSQEHRNDYDQDDQGTCRGQRHEPGNAPRRARGMSICPTCLTLVEETLIELPALFELCAHALDLRPNVLRERVSGHRPHGTVLHDKVASVRSEILGVLAAWAGLVASERGVVAPDGMDVRKLVGFLAIHLHWLCGHAAAPDFVDQLTHLTETANEAIQPPAGFRVAVGTCPGPGCDRTVYAEAHREGAEPYEVSCEAGHVWAPEHWLYLRGERPRSGGDGSSDDGRPSQERAE
jgi:hypothetical protein